MISDAKKKAQQKYDKENTKQVILKLNRKTDADIIKKLEIIDNIQGYMKNLVRSDLRSTSETLPLESIKLLILPVAKRNNLSSVILFGSYARNEATKESDVDLLIDGGDYKGLLGFMSIKEQFENALGKEVDLVSTTSLEENDSESGISFRNNIYKDKKVLYEK